jgi:hypothetical protein
VAELHEAAVICRYDLASTGQEWAEELGAYPPDYFYECWEVPDLAVKSGYPFLSLGKRGQDTVVCWMARPHPLFGTKTAVSGGLKHVSHSCHNIKCVNPAHCVYEPMLCNQGKGGCVGGDWCRHPTTCLRPGAYSRGAFKEAAHHGIDEEEEEEDDDGGGEDDGGGGGSGDEDADAGGGDAGSGTIDDWLGEDGEGGGGGAGGLGLGRGG